LTALTTGEKTLLRADGHKATLFLSALKPATLLAAQVNNASIARGARTIAYNGGTGTGYASIEAGQTLWVGTDADLNDVGTVRIKAVTGNQTSGTITVAENSLAWADGLDLTVKHNWELWPVFPRIVSGVFKKDYDVDYSDQNLKPPPVAVAGPPRAGFLSGGTLRFYLDATESYAMAPGASISSYLWSCSGGTINSPGSAATYIDFTTAGQYWLKLTVTDSNGKTQSTYRPIFVHSATIDDADYPYESFQFESQPAGDWDRGGWTARLKVYGAADIGDFPDGALALIWQQATYGSTVGNIGGYTLNSADARSVLFCGYIRADTTVQDWNVGTVSFDVTTVEALLRRHTMFSVSLQAVKGRNPAKWYEYVNNLTVARAVHHLWRWHSTLFSIADVMLPVSNTLKLRACDDFERGDLYSQAENLAYRHGIFAHACCNKWGRLHLEEDIQTLTDAQRAAKAPVNHDITAADRREAITLGRQPEKSTSMVHLSGMRYDGNSALPVIAKAPGTAPEDMGPAITTIERQVLSTQGTANALAGRALANANNTFKDVRILFKGHYLGALDIVPQEWWTLSLAAGDTHRAIVWNTQRLICRNASSQIDAGNGTILADGVFEKEAEGPDGVTGDYPTSRPSPITSFPPPPPPAVPPTQVGLTGSLLAGDGANGCWFRGPGYTDWVERNGGLASTAMTQLGWDPWWPTPYKQNTADPEQAIAWACEVGFIGRSTDCGRTWVDVTPVEDPPNAFGLSPAPTAATVTYVQRLDSIHQNELHIFLVEYTTGGDWTSYLLKTEDDGLTWTWTETSSNDLITDGVYYYASAFVRVNVENDITFHPAGTGSPCWTLGAVNPGNLVGEADDTGATFTYTYNHHNGFGKGRIDIDLGGTVTTDASGAVQVRTKSPIGETNNIFEDYVHSSVDQEIWVSADDVTYTRVSTLRWDSDSATWAWGTARTVGAHTFRYIRLTFKPAWFAMQLSQDGGIDSIRVGNVTSATAAESPVRPLWGDVDSEAGTVLYMTVWKTSEALALQKRQISDFALLAETDLGACTEAELFDDLVAFPYTPPFNGDYVWLFGRMDAPAGLGAGVQHVIVSDDGAATWASVESGWGADIAGTFRAEGAVDGGRTLYAIRNSAGAVPKLYAGLEALVYVSDLPFASGVGVGVDALSVSPAGQVAIGANAAGATMVAISDPPHTAWTDITDSYPADGAVSSLTYV